jgi:hypothetical protein
MNTLTNEEYEERKKTLEELKKLVKSEQEHVFRILKKYEEEFSENSNGIFFDMNSIKLQTLREIQEYLTFCAKNRNDFEMRDKEMETNRLNLGDTNSLV